LKTNILPLQGANGLAYIPNTQGVAVVLKYDALTARRFIYFPLPNNADFLAHLPKTKKIATQTFFYRSFFILCL